MTAHLLHVNVPSIPNAPKHVTQRAADADYYRAAARSIRHQASNGHAFAGSNVTEAVARLCDEVAAQLTADPTPRELATSLLRPPLSLTSEGTYERLTSAERRAADAEQALNAAERHSLHLTHLLALILDELAVPVTITRETLDRFDLNRQIRTEMNLDQDSVRVAVVNR